MRFAHVHEREKRGSGTKGFLVPSVADAVRVGESLGGIRLLLCTEYCLSTVGPYRADA